MKKQQANKRKDRVIFALFSPDKKYFYINQCLKSSLRETYRHNMKSRRTSSELFINTIKPNRPCLFVLEELPNATQNETYNHLLVWLKILLENNYTSFNNEPTITSAKRISPRNLPLYEKRKRTNLKLITACERCLVSVYKNQTCVNYKTLEAEGR